MTTELCKKLGARIRELRKIKGYSQSELADLLYMERSNLTRIENGKQFPNPENLLKISEILNVEIKDLYDFAHIKSKSVLDKEIIEILPSLSDKETQFIYKNIVNLKNL